MDSQLESIIVSRRTVREVRNDPLSLDEMKDILRKASYAPFHSKSEPWSVVIVADLEEKETLSKAVLDSYTRTGLFDSYKEHQTLKVRQATEEYFLTVPLHLVVATEMFGQEIKDFESIGATCALIQNIQLLCWERGIGVVWRTNSYIFDPLFAKDVGIQSNQKIMGTLHLGYPKRVQAPRERKPLDDWVRRLASVKHDDRFDVNRGESSDWIRR